MIKYTKRFSAVLFAITLALCTAFSVSAESTYKLMDDADLFTSSEEEQISSQLEDLTEQTGWDVIIYTNYNGIESDEMESYCNDYYDDNNFGCGDDNKGVFLTIDMSSREMYIITKGDAMYYFSDDRVDSILDEVQENLIDANYYAAAQAFIAYTGGFYNDGKPESGEFSNVELAEKEANPFLYVLKHYGIVILLVGIAVAAIAAVSVKMSYKNHGKKGTYDLKENSQVNLTEAQDIFLNKSVSVTNISSSSGSGGGRSGGSSGGSSHGGGGRSF